MFMMKSLSKNKKLLDTKVDFQNLKKMKNQILVENFLDLNRFSLIKHKIAGNNTLRRLLRRH
jgi:hypothetical protein